MRGVRVLIVDDELAIRRLLVDLFSFAGAEVYTAANGRLALEQFKAVEPDLVVLDLLMPVLDGWETCRSIRCFSPVPVLLLSALDDNRTIVRGLDAGADGYVSKPFNPQVLLARARALLRRSSSADQLSHFSPKS
jgi:two-component system, OmpR family, response regulator ResD